MIVRIVLKTVTIFQKVTEVNKPYHVPVSVIVDRIRSGKDRVLIDMLTFNESYRQIRANYKYQGFNCYSCRKKFQDGEKISVIFTDKGNKTVCHECGLNYQRELAEGQAHD